MRDLIDRAALFGVLLAPGLGLLHLLLSWRFRGLPVLAFLAGAGGLGALLGLVVVRDVLRATAREEPFVAAAWAVLLALGFAAAAVVAGTAWAGATQGLAAWVRKRRA